MWCGSGGTSPLLLSLFFFPLFFLIFSPQSFSQETSQIRVVPNLKEAMEIQADRLEYRKEEDRYEAEGSVQISQGKLRLRADRVILFNQTGEAQLSGHIFLFDGENTIEGEKGEINLQTQKGTFFNSRLTLQPSGYKIQGEILEKFSKDQYHLKNGWFTTCDCEEGGTPDWRFRVKELNLRLEGYIVAEDVTFYLKKVPVFYFPWLVYPALLQRQTGLLIPRLGYSSDQGFKYKQALFWAINAHRDATLTLDIRSDQGIGGGLEYRYKMREDSEGYLNTFVFHDSKKQTDLLNLTWTHRQNFTPHVQGRLDLHLVNDDSFFRDLSELTVERSQRSLESNLLLNYRKENQMAYLLGRFTQDLNASDNQTLQTLPEIGYSLVPTQLGSLPIWATVEVRGNNFWRDTGVTAQRFDFTSSLLTIFKPVSGLVLTPSIGFQEVFYARTQNAKKNIHREIYWVHLRADSKAARDFEMQKGGGFKKIRHQIESSILYEYVEKVENVPPPLFDAIEVLDRQHRVTYSVLQRFIAFFPKDQQGSHPEPLQFLKVKLTQSYNIQIPPVPVFNGDPDQRSFSDLRGEMEMDTPWGMRLDVDSFLDVRLGRWTAVNSDINFELMPRWNLGIGHRLTQTQTLAKRGDLLNPIAINQRVWVPEIHFLTLSSRINLPHGFTFANRSYYDIEHHEKTEIIYGIQFDSQCWSMALVFQDRPEEDTFFFMISLKGAGMTETGLLHKIFSSP